MPGRTATVGAGEYRYTCDCGWEGGEREIEDWDVQRDRDRVVRKCPDCEEPVPEWGAFRPVEAVARLAKGPLREALADDGVAGGDW